MTDTPKKRGGRASRDKGNRFEVAVVKRLADHGIEAQRVPLSGSAGGEFDGDIHAHLPADPASPWRLECKKKARAWLDLYQWLDKGPDALVIARDRAAPLVVLSMATFAKLAGGKS